MSFWALESTIWRKENVAKKQQRASWLAIRLTFVLNELQNLIVRHKLATFFEPTLTNVGTRDLTKSQCHHVVHQ